MTDIDTGRPLPSAVHSMNAYLGYGIVKQIHTIVISFLVCNILPRAFPIAKALNFGADVVITGRCVDSALALGPLIHKVHTNRLFQ